MGDRAAVSAGPTQASVTELRRWRKEVRTMSTRALAEQMGFDRSYVSHVEAGRHVPSPDFARRADRALSAGGQLWNVWQADAANRTGAARPAAGTAAGVRRAGGLVVEHDDAELRYAGGVYRASQRRQIFNAGAEPVTRYLMRISGCIGSGRCGSTSLGWPRSATGRRWRGW